MDTLARGRSLVCVVMKHFGKVKLDNIFPSVHMEFAPAAPVVATIQSHIGVRLLCLSPFGLKCAPALLAPCLLPSLLQ